MMTVDLKSAFKNEWNEPLIDVARNTDRFISMFNSYPVTIKRAVNKRLYIEKQLAKIKAMFAEEYLLTVPILANSDKLAANRMIAYGYSVATEYPEITFGHALKSLSKDIFNTINQSRGLIHTADLIGSLPPHIICREIKEILCVGVTYAHLQDYYEEELKKIDQTAEVSDVRSSLSEVVATLNRRLPKLAWDGSGKQLYQLLKDLKTKGYVNNTNPELADFVAECVQFKDNNPSKKTILDELNRNNPPTKIKRIGIPNKDE
jgi:hypothetical protein